MSADPITDNRLRAAFAPKYQLDRELTGGGMSRVFLATERELERKVVIKILPPDLAAGVNRERFRREIQFVAQLQHPHIVPLYTAGAEGDLLYYTMPFIEGESLKHASMAGETFTPRQVYRVLHDVVDALGYAHERGVIHRDIKPGNVLRSGSHSVVTDFGVAKAISAAMPAAGMTTSGMAIGTPAYMAPEQLAGDPKADHRVDIYAVGLLAYELLVGDSPFAATSPQETMAAQLTRAPEPIEKHRRDVPPAMAAMIMRCLEKRPESRPQSAKELLQMLDAMEIPSGEFAPMRARSRGWVAVGVAAAAVLVALTVWNRPEPAAPAAPPRKTVDTVTESHSDALLTRAESLAIAKVVAQQLAKMQPRGADAAGATKSASPSPSPGARSGAGASASGTANPGASSLLGAPAGTDMKKLADSLRNEIQRTIFDSLARAQAAAQASPPSRGSSRVFVETNTGRGPSRGQPPPQPGISREQLDEIMRAARGAGDFGRSSRGLDKPAFDARSANMGPPRRIVITEPSPPSSSISAVTPYIPQVIDSLRRAFGSQKRFIVVDQDSVRAALQKTRTLDDLNQLLNAELFVTPRISRVGHDSLSWQINLRDMTANSAYATRSWGSPPLAAGTRIPMWDSVVTLLQHQLEEMDHAPRRRPPDTAPGMPLGPEAYAARANNMGPSRRLVIWTHPSDPQHPDVEAMGTQLLDLMRKTFSGLKRYMVVPRDSTIAVLARSRQRGTVAKELAADLMISVRGSVQRADSVYWTVTVWDLSAYPTLEQKTVTAGRSPPSAPFANADSLTRLAVDALADLDRAPRRP